MGVDLKPTPTLRVTPDHFILITGKTGTHYQVVDPGHSANTTLDAYGNVFQTRGSISDPQQTDQSALQFVVTDQDFLVTDPSGNSAGFDPITGQDVLEIAQSTYTRDGEEDDETGDVLPNVSIVLDVRQPIPGTYHIQVNGQTLGAYTIAINAFSQDGSPQMPVTIAAIAATGSTSTFDVQSNSLPGSISTITARASFASTVADISNSLELGLIDNNGIANSLTQKLQAAQAARGPAQNNILNAFLNEVNAQSGKHITGTAPRVLVNDANSLIAQNQ